MSALKGLYPALVRAHRRLHTRGPLPRAPLPVFAVALGGLRAGGSGKTPLAHALARATAAQGLTVAVLSGGYSLDPARVRAPSLILDTRRSPERPPDLDALARCAARHGDEAAEAWLRFALDPPPPAGRVLWLTAPDRRDALALALRHAAPARIDLALLDDGLHHHRVAPHRAVAVVTPGDAAARALPFGPLRDDLTLLDRADRVVFYEPAPEARLDPADRALLARAHARASWHPGPLRAHDADPIDPRDFGAAALITATGAPARVREAATLAGLSVVHHAALRDHARFTPSLTLRLHATCRRLGLRPVVTLKDYVKLAAPWSRLRPRVPLRWLDGHACVSDGLTRILEAPCA